MIGGLNSLIRPIDVTIDESLLIHNSSNKQLWMIGGIETKRRSVRLIFSKDRTAQIIEKYIYDNFLEGTHFTHDNWLSYNVLNGNLNYSHETHHLDYSTSHIENYWIQYKNMEQYQKKIMFYFLEK